MKIDNIRMRKSDIKLIEKYREKRLRLGVFGSRSLKNEEAREIIEKEIKEYEIGEIVTAGEIKGASEEARKLCKKLAIPLMVIFPDPRHGRGKYWHRSLKIIANSDRILLIWDGESRGTAGEIKLVKDCGIEYNLYQLKRKISEFWELDEDWDVMNDNNGI